MLQEDRSIPSVDRSLPLTQPVHIFSVQESLSLLIDQKSDTSTWKNSEHIRHQASVKARDSFILCNLTNDIQEAIVSSFGFIILKSSSNNLVRICSSTSGELTDPTKSDIIPAGQFFTLFLVVILQLLVQREL